jgi:hypothetical protein
MGEILNLPFGKIKAQLRHARNYKTSAGQCLPNIKIPEFVLGLGCHRLNILKIEELKIRIFWWKNGKSWSGP